MERPRFGDEHISASTEASGPDLPGAAGLTQSEALYPTSTRAFAVHPSEFEDQTPTGVERHDFTGTAAPPLPLQLENYLPP